MDSFTNPKENTEEDVDIVMIMWYVMLVKRKRKPDKKSSLV